MKRVIMFMLDAAVQGATATSTASTPVAIVKVYDSEELRNLRVAKKAAFEALVNQNPEAGTVFEYDSPEFLAQQMEVYKIGKLIEAEITKLKTAEIEQKIAKEKNERLALNTAQFTAYDAMLAVSADKKATPEQKAEAAEVFRIAKEKVDNELLAKYGGVKTSNATGTAAPAGERGATGMAIKERLLFHINSGKTSTEAVKLVIAEDYSRGTVGSVRTAMVKAGEIAE